MEDAHLQRTEREKTKGNRDGVKRESGVVHRPIIRLLEKKPRRHESSDPLRAARRARSGAMMTWRGKLHQPALEHHTIS